MGIEGSGALLTNALIVYRDLFGGPIFSVGRDGQVYLSSIMFPDGTVQTTAGGGGTSNGNMLQISNDNNLTWPTPQLNQWSPAYQYYNFTSGLENASISGNVLTVNMNHGWQVGEVLTFTSMQSTFGFLNNQSVTITGITPPSSATITAVSASGHTITVTANNTFNAITNDVITLSGLTLNSFANGHTVTVQSRTPTSFTFQWNTNVTGIQWSSGAETGTAKELLNSAFTASFTHANVAQNAINGSVGTKVQPYMWVFDTFNKQWLDYAYIDSSNPAPGDPTLGAYSKLCFSRPVHFNDAGTRFAGIVQAGPLSLYHKVGKNENLFGPDYFDVAFGLATDVDPTESRIFTNIHMIYAEHRMNGAPILSPLATETAVTGLRMTVPDSHTNTWNTTYVAAINGIWNTVNTSNTNPFAGGNAIGVFGQSNLGNTNPSAATFVGVWGQATGVAATGSTGIGVRAQSSGFPLNYGVYIDAVSTGAGGTHGWNLASFNNNTPNAGYVGVWGNLILPDTYSGIRLARFGDGSPSNSDVAGKLAFSAATSASYTFLNSYGSTPMVFICPELPGQVQFSVTAISTTGFTITASAAFTGSVSYFIVGRN